MPSNAHTPKRNLAGIVLPVYDHLFFRTEAFSPEIKLQSGLLSKDRISSFTDIDLFVSKGFIIKKMLFRKKVKEPEETISQEAIKADKDKNGVPDYLQRENYASIINSNKDFLKWESDVETEIEQYIMSLKGYDFDVGDNLWKPISPPIINSFGINYIKSMIRSIINKHSINTYLSNDDVHHMCVMHMSAFCSTLKYRKRMYGIDLADLDSIAVGFDNLIYIILSRSVGDKQRIHNDNRMNMNFSNNESARM